MASDAYLDALKMLARRELSEAQLRGRLARRGHEEGAVEDAVARLKASRAIDDVRAAEAMARTEAVVKRRGRLRVRRRLESAGIAPRLARQTVDEVFAQTDEAAQIDAALDRRLRPGQSIDDDRGFQRLYRYLVAQGFEPERVLDTLNRRRARRD